MDSNVLLDVFTEDPRWFDWSAEALMEAASTTLVINPIIYAEASVRFDRIEDLEDALPADRFVREELPWPAAFLAGKAFIAYRRHGGARRSPLPDFYIGAHAAVRGYSLLTRDPKRYAANFPTVDLIAPNVLGIKLRRK